MELSNQATHRRIDLQSEQQSKNIPSATSIPQSKCAIPLSKRWHNSGGNLFICYANWCISSSWKVRHKERWYEHHCLSPKITDRALNDAWVIPSSPKNGTHVRTPTGQSFLPTNSRHVGILDLLRDGRVYNTTGQHVQQREDYYIFTLQSPKYKFG